MSKKYITGTDVHFLRLITHGRVMMLNTENMGRDFLRLLSRLPRFLERTIMEWKDPRRLVDHLHQLGEKRLAGRVAKRNNIFYHPNEGRLLSAH